MEALHSTRQPVEALATDITTTEPKGTGVAMRSRNASTRAKIFRRAATSTVVVLALAYGGGVSSASIDNPPTDEHWSLVVDRGYGAEFLLPQRYEIDADVKERKRTYECLFQRKIGVNVAFLEGQPADLEMLSRHANFVEKTMPKETGALNVRISDKKKHQLLGRPAFSYRVDFLFEDGEYGVFFTELIGGDYVIFIQSFALRRSSDDNAFSEAARYQSMIIESMRFSA